MTDPLLGAGYEPAADPAPTCRSCGDPLGGGPGGWYSKRTSFERCALGGAFHEPEDA